MRPQKPKRQINKMIRRKQKPSKRLRNMLGETLVTKAGVVRATPSARGTEG